MSCHKTLGLFTLLCLCFSSGCWAPLYSPGIPANCLPESFRTPIRTAGPPLNFSNLTARPPSDYILGPNDILEVTVSDLYRGAEIRPLRVQVMASGEVHLPLAGPVRVGGMNLMGAQQAITKAYADGFLRDPRVNVALAAESTTGVVVLGNVKAPGVYDLPKYQNDVGHALAAAKGLSKDAADIIEVHRRISMPPGGHVEQRLEFEGAPRIQLEVYEENAEDPKMILRIPLRGLPPGAITEEDVILHPGDVVVVPSRKHEVFWVVGQLNDSNLIRFSLGDRERELGTGLVLPRERDIDVVTAVAMAGYIDPIDSPTTVTVHRTLPSGEPLLIIVDLIAARYDRRETVLVAPGDIIYLNPDAPWWFRRTFDRVIGDLIVIPYGDGIARAIFGR